MDTQLESDMNTVRSLVEKIHSKRKEVGIAVRRPLVQCTMNNAQCTIADDLIQLIKEETNIKTITCIKGEGEMEVTVDTTMTPELEKEGEVRGVIRTIQQLRKVKGCAIDDTIRLTVPKNLQTLDLQYIELMKRETLAKEILWGDSYDISISN
jgi:isoleucyl-tRNA synthetase